MLYQKVKLKEKTSHNRTLLVGSYLKIHEKSVHCAKSSFILNDVQDLFIECPSVDQKLWQISYFCIKGPKMCSMKLE